MAVETTGHHRRPLVLGMRPARANTMSGIISCKIMRPQALRMAIRRLPPSTGNSHCRRYRCLVRSISLSRMNCSLTSGREQATQSWRSTDLKSTTLPRPASKYCWPRDDSATQHIVQWSSGTRATPSGAQSTNSACNRNSLSGCFKWLERYSRWMTPRPCATW